MVAALNWEGTPSLYMLTVPAVISDGFCGIEYDGTTTVSLWNGVLNAHPLANSQVTSEFLPLPLRGVAVTTTGPRTLSLTTRPSPPKRPRHVSLTVEEPSQYRALLHALSLSAISPRGIRLLRPLGRGGQGRVYLGRTLKNKLLAVKLIPGDSTEGIRESELSLHAPQSENVVQTHFTRVCSTHTLIATEYVVGATLHEAATAGKGMDTEFLQRVAKCVLRGIYDLHRAGIAHRDVKLENVLLSEDGSIKICDLGSGASFRDGAPMRWRGTISTLYVAAPELSRGDCHGPEVDLWAAGALLLALRTRRAMLGGKHRERVISAMTEKENCGEDTLPVVMTKEEISEAPELFCDLLRGLLKVEVSKRLTAEQALKNKWVQGRLGEGLKSNRVQRIRGKVRAIVRLVLLWRSAVTAHAAKALAPSSTFLPVAVR